MRIEFQTREVFRPHRQVGRIAIANAACALASVRKFGFSSFLLFTSCQSCSGSFVSRTKACWIVELTQESSILGGQVSLRGFELAGQPLEFCEGRSVDLDPFLRDANKSSRQVEVEGFLLASCICETLSQNALEITRCDQIGERLDAFWRGATFDQGRYRSVDLIPA